MRTPKTCSTLFGRVFIADSGNLQRASLPQGAITGETSTFEAALAQEQRGEQERDNESWRPLRVQLEQLRRDRR
jgi:hypothetical protein